MTPDREKLRQLAERATKGPWRWDRTTINAHIHQVDGLHWLASCVIGHGDWHSPDESEGVKNASFIAAANPAAVLSLLDEMEQVEAERDDCRQQWGLASTAHQKAEVAITRLKADLAEARGQRDAYREALTPSGDTKTEYIGEIKERVMCLDQDGEEAWRDHTISWDATKATMAMILARAASVHSRLSGEVE